MQIAGADERTPPLAPGGTGPLDGHRPVLLALLAADIAPATAVGNLAELLDVDVEQVAGVFVLVAANRFTGGPVNVGQAVDPAAHQDCVHRGGGHVEPVADLDRTQP